MTVTLEGNHLTAKGKLGELSRDMPPFVVTSLEDNEITVKRLDDSRKAREQHGLARTLAYNMVHGVNEGWNKKLTMVGVGYRAAMEGKTLVMSLGYSHPVKLDPPEGVKAEVEGNVNITISGANKEHVGDFAAKCRAWRPPEPYKGKGVKYADEIILRKEGKSGR